MVSIFQRRVRQREALCFCAMQGKQSTVTLALYQMAAGAEKVQTDLG